MPHWTGPAFIPLTVIAAAYWSERYIKPRSTHIPFRIVFPGLFLAAILSLAVYCINYSHIQFGKTADIRTLGEYDFTQDLYGWEIIGKAFKKVAEREEISSNMPKGAGLISYKWFPAAHEDFYIARPLGRELFLIGALNDIHEYYWINKDRGGLVEGNDYYHIAVSNYYRDPVETFGNYFEKIAPIDTIAVTRGNVVMRYAFIYRMKNFKQNIK